ncbi:N-methyl-L-tryptophan oxidase [Puia sp.]|uniref:N-methyl-L-tryptophan oxidase n=1 Tax=Puia sp. TaxID=2045100 RepID=UPI002F3E1EA4
MIGLGANGSSALWHLAKTGKKVLGIDRFQPPHQRGSSHGESRIIRQAYHESPFYVPLVKAAYPLWAELEAAAGKPLFQKTGGLLLGAADTAVVQGARLSAETHGIPFEWLDATAIRNRFPAFRPTPDTVGVLEKEAGILYPEECIRAFLTQAAAHGAAIHTGEPVLSITPGASHVTLTTPTATYDTATVIIAAGAWLNTLLPELELPLSVRRQPLFWFGNAGRQFHPAAMPIFIWEYEKEKMFYGFPDIGAGVKLAPHHGGRPIAPDDLLQAVSPEEISQIKALAETWLSIDPVFHHAQVCLYTNTPDEHFIIDIHPQHPNIIVASPCSGHGFKFSSFTGKILADLALTGRSAVDLSPFTLDRPALH